MAASRRSGSPSALWTGFTFVGYFTPIRDARRRGRCSSALGPWELFWVLFYGFATYGNAGFMREQVCKYMCPYARFQSAMFDQRHADHQLRRGARRAARLALAQGRPEAALGLGDCIDCTLCVQVCPTGIDIRKGLQYECIGCAACIDVCDGVMDKMDYPRGLIRYATQNGLAQQLSRAQTCWRACCGRACWSTRRSCCCWWRVAGDEPGAAQRRSSVDVVRDRGALARLVDDGQIENVYRLQMMNATELPQRYRVAVQGLPGIVLDGPDTVEVAPAAGALDDGVGAHSRPAPRPTAAPVRMPWSSTSSACPGRRRTAWRRAVEKSTFVVPR